MRKKFIIFYLIILFTFGISPAFAARYLPEFKAGYFRPFSDTLRALYSDGWGDYQFEFSYSPWNCCDNCCWRNFFAWGGYNYIWNHGRTRSGLDDSEIDVQIHNFSAGIKYLQPLPLCFDVYGSVGLRYLFLRIDNRDDDSVEPRERANGLGGVLGAGFLFHPYRSLVLDMFALAMIKRFDKSNFERDNGEIAKSINVSGVTIGLGIGWCF